MKKLIILLTFLFIILGCKSITYKSDLKMIKSKSFNNIKYDWYTVIKPVGNYMMYTKETVLYTSTNYIYGEFKLLSYQEYMDEK